MSNSSVFDLSYLSHEVENIDVSDRQFDKYVGHLKRENKCIALRQHHFLLAECDDKGNLTKKDLFVQFVGVKVDNERKYVLLCRKRNMETEGLLQILLKRNIGGYPCDKCGIMKPCQHLVSINVIS